MTLLKVLAVAAIVSMAGTPAIAAGAKSNAAAKLSLEQPNVYPQGAPQGQAPNAKAKGNGASHATLPLALAGAAAVVAAALVLGKSDSTPASN